MPISIDRAFYLTDQKSASRSLEALQIRGYPEQKYLYPRSRWKDTYIVEAVAIAVNLIRFCIQSCLLSPWAPR